MIDEFNLKEKYPDSYLLEYYREIVSGEIIIGHELRTCLDMLIDDLKRDTRYQYDLTEARKRIKFIETKCHHSISPFAGQAFLLELWQKAFVEIVYGFKMQDTETGEWVRRFKEVLLVIGRKNGKSSLCAALANCEFFCGPVGVNILCASNDFEQSSICFNEINNMREESRSLEKVSRKNISGIYMGNPRQRRTKGKFSYQNKAKIKKLSARSGAKEGRNIDFAIIDEVHEMKDNSLVLPVKQSMSTKIEPLLFQITTEGFTNDGYLDGLMIEARKWLTGELDRPRWLPFLFTQDSEAEIWQDEKSWAKSNPGIGKIKRWSAIRGMVEEAKTSKSTRAFVLAKDFNIKQNNAAAWLTPEDINNPETFDVEEFRNCFAIGAVDLSKTGDLSSARALLMKPGSSKKYMLQQYFIPQTKLEGLSEKERKRYELWVRERRLVVSDGNENDFRHVTAWFVKLLKEYGIRFFKIGYDKWSAIYWVKEMESYGFDCQRVGQDWGSMSEPMSLVETDLKSKLINYNHDPIDKMCLENTAMNINSKAEIMPMKVQGKEDNKIDGTVTMIIAYRIYIDNRTDFLELVKRTTA